MNNQTTIFTIGHSDLDMSRFLSLLNTHSISAIADVRSTPYSRFNPQFNREELQSTLKATDISYVFLGDELGARRSEPECYVNCKAHYGLIAKTSAFQHGLERLKRGALNYRIALLCAEKDPITCHRAILVGRCLRVFGVAISHILYSGQLETNESMERRLLKVIRMEGGDLFSTEAEAIEQAYDIQGDRIAYVMNGIAGKP
jgi:uncharacterized protein (DUF488 family)